MFHYGVIVARGCIRHGLGMMSLRNFVVIVAAMAFGTGIMTANAGWFGKQEGTEFLRKLKISDLMPKGSTNGCEVLQDATTTMPSAPIRISRRIVFRTPTAADDLQILARDLDTAIERSIDAHGARQTGEESFSSDTTKLENGKKTTTSIYAPRYQYQAGRTRGVAEIIVIGVEGGAVVIISLAE